MQQPDLTNGIIWYVVFVYSTVCHEAAHAWTSHKLGDNTAYEGGQVSLDPIPHIRREPIGMVVMPIVSYLANGWVTGWASAPYDPRWAVIYPKRAALMAMAGPLANLLLVLLSVILIFIGAKAGVFVQPSGSYIVLDQVITSTSGTGWEACALVLSITFSLNLLLFMFNLMPLPPMDGSAIPLFFLRGDSAVAYQRMMWQPAMQIFGFIVAIRGFSYIFWPVYKPVLAWVYTLM